MGSRFYWLPQVARSWRQLERGLLRQDVAPLLAGRLVVRGAYKRLTIASGLERPTPSRANRQFASFVFPDTNSTGWSTQLIRLVRQHRDSAGNRISAQYVFATVHGSSMRWPICDTAGALKAMPFRPFSCGDLCPSACEKPVRYIAEPIAATAWACLTSSRHRALTLSPAPRPLCHAGDHRTACRADRVATSAGKPNLRQLVALVRRRQSGVSSMNLYQTISACQLFAVARRRNFSGSPVTSGNAGWKLPLPVNSSMPAQLGCVVPSIERR